MLGKLLKHEFKTTGRFVPVVMIAAVFLGLSMYVSKLFDSTFFMGISSLMFFLLAAVLIILTIVMVIARFSKSMYGLEGALSHTLPVKGSSLFLSKFFVAFFWILVSIVFAAGMVFVGVAILTENVMMKELMPILKELKPFLDKNMVIFIVTLLVAVLLQLFCTLNTIFFSITLSQVKPFQKMGNIGAVLFYFVLNNVMGLLAIPLTMYVPFSVNPFEGFVWRSMETSMTEIISATTPDIPDPTIAATVGLGGIALYLVIGIAYMVLNSYLINKKVNIKS